MPTIQRLYTGDDGLSHIEQVHLPLETEGNQGQVTPIQAATGIRFGLLRPGFFSDWHNAPRRQYSITISGEVEIRSRPVKWCKSASSC